MRETLLCLLLAATTAPDILPPGHKDVRHELILEWGDDNAQHRFVASPTAGFHGHVEIRRGEPFTFSSKYGTRIYAAPAGAQLPPAGQRMQEVTWPSADVPVREVQSIASGHPLARVETKLRVTQVSAEGIRFEQVSERRFDAHGLELGGLDWLPLCVFGAAGAFWLLRLERRNRRTAAAA